MKTDSIQDTETANILKEKYEISEDCRAINDFDDKGLNLSDNLLRGIYAYGYEKPSPIQKYAILPMKQGRDVIAQSQSGTGKTATFIIGLLERIDPSLKCYTGGYLYHLPVN